MMKWCCGDSSRTKRGSGRKSPEVSDAQVRVMKERLETKENNGMGSNEQDLLVPIPAGGVMA